MYQKKQQALYAGSQTQKFTRTHSRTYECTRIHERQVTSDIFGFLCKPLKTLQQDIEVGFLMLTNEICWMIEILLLSATWRRLVASDTEPPIQNVTINQERDHIDFETELVPGLSITVEPVHATGSVHVSKQFKIFFEVP